MELNDLKYDLSGYILPRLQAFKNKIDNKEVVSFPNFKNEDSFSNIKNPSIELIENFWSEKLEEMIFPFDYYNDSGKFDNLDSIEIRNKVKNGLECFAKYFDDLWI